jgi:hypothetical protein
LNPGIFVKATTTARTKEVGIPVIKLASILSAFVSVFGCHFENNVIAYLAVIQNN